MSDKWVLYAENNIRGRACGSCKLCCTLVPADTRPKGKVKPAGERCSLLCARGCSVYETRPDPCRYWSCRWLFDEKTANIRRPDKVGYCIDPQLEQIIVNGNVAFVMQIWVDPQRPDAYRDPALRDFIARVSLPAIIRYGNEAAFVLVPPALCVENAWIEVKSNLVSKEAHNASLAAQGVNPLLELNKYTVRAGNDRVYPVTRAFLDSD